MGFGLRNKFHRAKQEIGYRLHNAVSRSNKRLRAIYLEPTDMCDVDRIMLYALILGLRPSRVLEIGVRWGGGARIISEALERCGHGNAVGIDPDISSFRPSRRDLFNRYELVQGYSPEAIPLAVEKLGGQIDLAFIDAMHTHDHVLADFAGVLPHIKIGGHVLLHDAFHVGIDAAISHLLSRHPSLVDCGIITRHPYIDNAPVAYQGLRLVRNGDAPTRGLIENSFIASNRKADFSPELFNWDHYWNRIR